MIILLEIFSIVVLRKQFIYAIRYVYVIEAQLGHISIILLYYSIIQNLFSIII